MGAILNYLYKIECYQLNYALLNKIQDEFLVNGWWLFIQCYKPEDTHGRKKSPRKNTEKHGR